jgi:hypothetical protein
VPRKWDLPKACFQGGSPKRHDEAIGQKGQSQVLLAESASPRCTGLLSSDPTSAIQGLTQMGLWSLIRVRSVNFASLQLRTTAVCCKAASLALQQAANR